MPTWRLYALLVVAAPFAAVGGPFLLVALAIGLIGVCAAAVDWSLASDGRRIVVARRLQTDKLSLGAWNPVEIHVDNVDTTARGQRVEVRDQPPASFQLDRATPMFETQVAPSQSAVLTYRVRPAQRGDAAFGELYLRVKGPLRLVKRTFKQNESTLRVRVYPNLRELRRYDLVVRRGLEAQAAGRPVRVAGASTEFERVREYLPDDEFRRINWKATARRGQPLVNQFEAERSQNLVLLLDCGRTMAALADARAGASWGSAPTGSAGSGGLVSAVSDRPDQQASASARSSVPAGRRWLLALAGVRAEAARTSARFSVSARRGAMRALPGGPPDGHGARALRGTAGEDADFAASQAALTKLDRAVNTALLLAHVASQRGDRVALLAYADDIRAFVPPQRGHRALLATVEALYNLHAEPVEPDHARAFSFLAQRNLRRSLVVLFTDLVDRESSALLAAQVLRAARHHMVVCVTLADPNIRRPAEARPADGRALFEKMVAQQLLDDRAAVLASFAAHGVLTIDTDADALNPRLIAAYLELKQSGRI